MANTNVCVRVRLPPFTVNPETDKGGIMKISTVLHLFDPKVWISYILLFNIPSLRPSHAYIFHTLVRCMHV
jgi:hypothetical protein